MKEVELFFWFLPAKSPRHKPSRTRYRMSREEAAARMPTAWPDLSDRMVIQQPETPEEQHQAFLAMHGQRGIYQPK